MFLFPWSCCPAASLATSWGSPRPATLCPGLGFPASLTLVQLLTLLLVWLLHLSHPLTFQFIDNASSPGHGLVARIGFSWGQSFCVLTSSQLQTQFRLGTNNLPYVFMLESPSICNYAPDWLRVPEFCFPWLLCAFSLCSSHLLFFPFNLYMPWKRSVINANILRVHKSKDLWFSDGFCSSCAANANEHSLFT